MRSFETFLQLHRQTAPFLLGNIWDVNSALTFEANNYQAIATSSQAVARSWGYEDGEKIGFELLLSLAKRVVERVDLPFSVDLEKGYGQTIGSITRNIDRLHDVGVVGINLEDSNANTSELQTLAVFQKTIAAVTDHISRNNLKIFLNIRTDAYLLGMRTAYYETLARISAYEVAGAAGIFVPCITRADQIKEVVNSTRLPINVMCMPGLPDFDQLASLGVKRISMGSFFFDRVYENAGRLSRAINTNRNFSPIL